MAMASHPSNSGEDSEIDIDEETRWSGQTEFTCSCVICGVPVFVVSAVSMNHLLLMISYMYIILNFW